MSCVTCPVSHVTCHVSCVTCYMSYFFFFDKVFKLIGGGSVINRAYPVYFFQYILYYQRLSVGCPLLLKHNSGFCLCKATRYSVHLFPPASRNVPIMFFQQSALRNNHNHPSFIPHSHNSWYTTHIQTWSCVITSILTLAPPCSAPFFYFYAVNLVFYLLSCITWQNSDLLYLPLVT